MHRRRIIIAHVAGIGLASALAEVMAKNGSESDIEVMTEDEVAAEIERHEDMLYGHGVPVLEPMGLASAYQAKPIADTRDYIPLPRPGRNEQRHRPKDQYHQRKQGWKPRR